MEEIKQAVSSAIKKNIIAELETNIQNRARRISDEIVATDSFPNTVERLVNEATQDIMAELAPKQDKPPRFASLYQFAEKFLLPMYGTTKSQSARAAWSPKWWAHPEAVARVDTLWRRFELLRIQEPLTHLETFLRLYGDYHMRHLMDSNGVFAQCAKSDYATIPLRSAPMN